MQGDDEHDAPDGDPSRTGPVGRAVSHISPSRRRLLTMVGAGLVGAGATNPGMVAKLVRQVPLGSANSSPLDLVPHSRMTHTAVESGRWDDASVWEDGTPPDDEAWVHIPEDVTVTLTGATARLRTLRVDGTLTFDPATATHLLVDIHP